jgi:hypothetical protein
MARSRPATARPSPWQCFPPPQFDWRAASPSRLDPRAAPLRPPPPKSPVWTLYIEWQWPMTVGKLELEFGGGVFKNGKESEQ